MSDHSEIILKMWERRKKNVPSVELKTFGRPVQLSTALDGVSYNISSTESRDVSLSKVILPLRIFPVRIRSVQ